jgi:uncharacterized protein (TIGR04255 family)
MPDLLQSASYSKAPITEAVIDFLMASMVPQSDQDRIVARLRNDYPHVSDLQEMAVDLDVTGGSLRIDQKLRGHKLMSDDRLDTATVQPNRLTISRLAPYTGWEALEARARADWNTWRRFAGHKNILRIGVRFINRIDIPAKTTKSLLSTAASADLSRYVRLLAQDPVNAGTPIDSYLIQIIRPSKLDNWKHSITSTLVTPPALVNYISILLDIDVFRQNDIPHHPDRLFETLNEARLIKNDIFERCITDDTRTLIS